MRSRKTVQPKGVRRLGAALAIALLVGACGPSGPKVNLDGTEVVVRGTATVTGDRFSLGAFDNFFDPTILRGEPRAAVTFVVRNFGRRVHNVSLPAQAVDQDLQPGTETAVAIMLPESGRLVFFCKFHREDSGMAGAFETGERPEP